MGSVGQADKPKDLVVTHKGLFILADYGNYFCQERYCDNDNEIWRIVSSYILEHGVILLNPSDLDIIEINGDR